MKRGLIVGILVLAFLGITDSVYILQHEITSTPLLCDINNLSGCNAVVSSPYSYVFGIPLAGYGAFFYGLIFIFASFELVLINQFLRRCIQGASLVGATASVYFITIQAFVIEAFCVYCLVSACISIGILILAAYIEPLRREVADSFPETRLPLFPSS